MNRLQVARGVAGLLLGATLVAVSAVVAPDGAARAEPARVEPGSTTGERDRGTSAERDARGKAPPPRPIVAPEGQQQNPALREECAWLGQRIVSLLYRDDAMTGNDFVPFYLRFGCPEEHIGRSFGCVVGSGGLAENDVLADRIAQCWTDPARRPMAATAAGEAPAGDKQGTAAGAKPAEKNGAAKPAEPPAASPTSPSQATPVPPPPAPPKPADPGAAPAVKPGEGPAR